MEIETNKKSKEKRFVNIGIRPKTKQLIKNEADRLGMKEFRFVEMAVRKFSNIPAS